MPPLDGCVAGNIVRQRRPILDPDAGSGVPAVSARIRGSPHGGFR
ncbi:MAG: hypothetical protein ACJ8BF_11980 [Gemmatimonadales bacterium]